MELVPYRSFPLPRQFCRDKAETDQQDYTLFVHFFHPVNIKDAENDKIQIQFYRKIECSLLCSQIWLQASENTILRRRANVSETIGGIQPIKTIVFKTCSWKRSWWRSLLSAGKIPSSQGRHFASPQAFCSYFTEQTLDIIFETSSNLTIYREKMIMRFIKRSLLTSFSSFRILKNRFVKKCIVTSKTCFWSFIRPQPTRILTLIKEIVQVLP